MRMNTTFTVTARCNVYESNSREIDDKSISYKQDIELHFNRDTAANFLFRFAPYAFNLDGYKIIFIMNGSTEVKGIELLKDNKVYVVLNVNQIFLDVHEGYYRIITCDKLDSILNFDFNETDESEIEDEFSNNGV